MIPNDTVRVRWVLASSIKAVKSLTLENIVWHMNLFRDYFGEDKQGQEDQIAGCLFSHETSNTLGQCDVSIVGNINPTMINLMLDNGHFGHSIVMKRLGAMEEDILWNKRWLAAISMEGCPGFYKAMQYGRIESVQAFIKLVLTSYLDDRDKQELLAGKFHDGTAAFYIAMQKGHSECVKLFIEAVNNSKLNAEEKHKLLAGKRGNGTPAFFIAMQKGHSECVKLFIEAVVDNKEKYELLAGKSDVGTPAFFIAMQKGHSECVKLFIKAVDNSQLNAEEKDKLLAGKRGDATPVFYIAM